MLASKVGGLGGLQVLLCWLVIGERGMCLALLHMRCAASLSLESSVITDGKEQRTEPLQPMLGCGVPLATAVWDGMCGLQQGLHVWA